LSHEPDPVPGDFADPCRLVGPVVEGDRAEDHIHQGVGKRDRLSAPGGNGRSGGEPLCNLDHPLGRIDVLARAGHQSPVPSAGSLSSGTMTMRPSTSISFTRPLMP
jgi:hypothetical protein